MSVYFERPVGLIQRESNFSSREVGLTHPVMASYIRLADNGDIHIMANQNTGIIISPSKDTILLVANSVKLLTNDEDGFKWNTLSFNPHATLYTEPPLVAPKKSSTNLYDDIDSYLD